MNTNTNYTVKIIKANFDIKNSQLSTELVSKALHISTYFHY